MSRKETEIVERTTERTVTEIRRTTYRVTVFGARDREDAERILAEHRRSERNR